MGFQTEQKAYEFFMANVGLDAYCDLLFSMLGKIPGPTGVVGFSMGASAVWKISESLITGNVKRIVCFYGSQVRHMTTIRPVVVVDHVLPAHEPPFDVDELAIRLSGKKKLCFIKHRTCMAS